MAWDPVTDTFHDTDKEKQQRRAAATRAHGRILNSIRKAIGKSATKPTAKKTPARPQRSRSAAKGSSGH